MAKADKEDLDVVLNLRISETDQKGLRELAESLPFAHVARVCLRLGMKAVRDKPALLLGEKLAKRGPKPRKRSPE